MYKLEINDLKELNLFLNLNDLEYVDLFLSRGKSILVSNTAELFAALSLYTECSADESSANIRLPRKMLASLVCEGNIVIKVKENEVVLLFYANDQTQERYSVTLGRQEVFSASYDKKIQILSEIDNANRFNAGDIKDIVNIGRAASSVISCQNGVASVTLVGRGRVFKPIEFKNNFAVSAARLSRLLSVSNTLFDIENYVGVATKELSILATKSRGSDNSDFELIQHEKSNAVFEANFENLYVFLAKININLENITVNLDRRCCDIEESNKKYSIPVTITNLKRVGAVSEIKIPYYVFKTVLLHKSHNTLRFSNTRNFIRVVLSNLVLAF